MTRLMKLSALLLVAGCASMHSGPSATARLQPTAGNTASGTVTFAQSGGKVLVSGEVRGLKPNALHGFHVHEKGDCSGADGMTTGGHFNPDGKPHGEHGHAPHHAGDLMSLKSDANGVASFKYESATIAVGSGAANDVVGRGLIVHRDPDDYKTQPTGNSGARIACAVITKA
ncbi:superoxide dismutase family protein [Ramlibacter sp. PS4R-6]|uniref:superoxide dismutase family protein n=1 Tax=Ramlibacter sp. PS4R-6 TaxID=3133438 RepID=UPI0030AC4F38